MIGLRARAGVAALLATAGLATTAVADPGVRVTLPGRSPVLITAAQIAAESDVPAGDVALRASADRPADRISHPAALSVRKLLVLAGADPDGLSYLSIPRPRGGLTVLRASDLADPPPFADGPPLVWIDGPVTHLLRPQRDDDDLNAADDVATTSGTPLELAARTGALLAVRAAVTPSTTKASVAITFTAAVTNPPAGERLTVSWHFDDGSVGVGGTVRHAYSAPGSYRPYATVEGSAGAGGASDPISVRVGKAPKRSSSPTPGDGSGTGDAGKAPSSGADTSNGGGSPSNGSGGGGPGSGSGAGSSGSDSSGSTGSGSGSAPVPRAQPSPIGNGSAAPSGGNIDPVTGLPIPSSIAAPAAGSDRAPVTGSDRSGRQPGAPVTPSDAPPATFTGTPVSGELIAATDRGDVARALGSSPAKGGSAAVAAAGGGGTPGRSPIGLLAGLGALALLLGGGALREVRRR